MARACEADRRRHHQRVLDNLYDQKALVLLDALLEGDMTLPEVEDIVDATQWPLQGYLDLWAVLRLRRPRTQAILWVSAPSWTLIPSEVENDIKWWLDQGITDVRAYELDHIQRLYPNVRALVILDPRGIAMGWAGAHVDTSAQGLANVLIGGDNAGYTHGVGCRLYTLYGGPRYHTTEIWKALRGIASDRARRVCLKRLRRSFHRKTPRTR